MSGTCDTLIRNATVVDGDGARHRDVAIENGRFAALLEPGSAAHAKNRIDATGLHLMPGAIDIHCHIRAPAFPERGSVESETRAAAAGGITTVFEMPITKPCCNSAERVRLRRDHFADRALVNFGLYAAPGSLERDDVGAMVDAGIIGFKMFTTALPEGREDEFIGLAQPDDADQLEALKVLAATGLPVVVHAESAQLLDHFSRLGTGLDPARASTHGALRPDVCEAVAVAKLLSMNMVAGARLHIAHVTSALTVDVLRRFAGSSDFSAETCPHYLVRTEADVERAGVYAKINPPVRSQSDQDALWSALADGTIRHVTTDHASFSRAEKEAFLGDFVNAPPGSPGLEILVPTMLDAVARGRLDLAAASDLVSRNAAERFGLGRKGRIAVGDDADLMLVDLAGETRVESDRLFTHARQVAQLYEGAVFKGRVMRTMVRGATVFEAGKVVAAAGWGRYVAPGTGQAGRAVA